MKISSIFLLGFMALILASCQKDEVESSQNSGNPNTTLSYPATYNEVSFAEFKLWVAGEEINTQGLDVQDYVSQESYDNILGMEDLPAEINLQDDTMFVTSWEGETALSPYNSSGDSIFIDTQSIFGNILFAIETPYALLLKRGMVYSARYSSGGPEILFENSQLQPDHFTFENSTSVHEYENLEQMGESDTLVIFNQTFSYE